MLKEAEETAEGDPPRVPAGPPSTKAAAGLVTGLAGVRTRARAVSSSTS